MNEYFWFSIFVLVNATILFSLAINVSRIRLKYKVCYGDAGESELKLAIRAHGNCYEQVPIYALLILSLSFLSASGFALSILVVAFSLTRISHAYGVIGNNYIVRRISAIATYILQFSATAALLWLIIA